MAKIRLDVLLHERGLIPTRAMAKAVIMSGSVFVNGERAIKPGMQIEESAEVDVRGGEQKYASRGGLKLEKALQYFGVSPDGKVCIDCGASTGGFTDCLLQNGAKLVYAVDVGYGQLAWSLRSDPRVIVMERTNVRHLTRDKFETRPQLAAIDVSFISLKLVLPAVREVLTDDGEVICLIKPQFEAGRGSVGKKGVVRDRQTHKSVLDVFLINAEEAGFRVQGLTFSPVTGPEGNIEYLGWINSDADCAEIDTEAIVSASHDELLRSSSDE
ncbi:MAG: TlyA family RNA methyltransferase [Oscillospiraceae bacterium]|nr:TlyA family RNA methyltransferase [Oscillospiraceae bacterium]